jgi:2-polyprenyl-3-methyl-5-hydroxy-6-metoxy-1,4-benzoquinol methylase
MNTASISRAHLGAVEREKAAPICPACGMHAQTNAEEVFHKSSRYACSRCDLHFWHPVSMPDASWHEMAYQGRDQTAMPLEPGHRFFLSDPKAPKGGRLLDLGCGVGNFLAAARDAGFDVTGIELNQNAIRFAREHYRLQSVAAMLPEEFLAKHPNEKFEVVTFFEVLEHQEDPQGFLNIAKECLADRGFLALSVPNRSRWQKGFEALDYPPNHLTRWSPRALRNFLEQYGFEVLTMLQEPLGVHRAAQVLSSGLRTGLVSRMAGEQPPVLADLAEMKPEEMERTMRRLGDSFGHRMAARLVGWKNLALMPAAGLLLPFLRLRGYTGLYLYCLARRNNPASSEAVAIRAGV